MLDWEMKGSLLNIVSDRVLLSFIKFYRLLQHADIWALASLADDFVPTGSLGLHINKPCCAVTKSRIRERTSTESKHPLAFPETTLGKDVKLGVKRSTTLTSRAPIFWV